MPPRASKSPQRAKSPKKVAASPNPKAAKAAPAKAARVVWGDYVAHDHLSMKNLLNALLCAVVLVPSIILTRHLYTACSPKTSDASDLLSATLGSAQWCKIAINRPITLANLLFFSNVTVGFWIIGLVQHSFWLIDPYWTILPPVLGHLYQLHPLAKADPTRSALTLALLWIWSIRLTHSYFRREEWKFGQREDWRYTKMAKDYPKLWPILSFFAVGLAQQPMLIGISAPAYTAHNVDTPFGLLDVLCAVGCIAGLATAYVADNQLRAYMSASPRPTPILNTGLWKYSRHPNYFGEQLWWWSFAGFAVSLGQPIMLCGTAFNSIILATVTFMTEERMLTNWSAPRAKLYRAYIASTSPCIPWFKRGA